MLLRSDCQADGAWNSFPHFVKRGLCLLVSTQSLTTPTLLDKNPCCQTSAVLCIGYFSPFRWGLPIPPALNISRPPSFDFTLGVVLQVPGTCSTYPWHLQSHPPFSNTEAHSFNFGALVRLSLIWQEIIFPSLLLETVLNKTSYTA